MKKVVFLLLYAIIGFKANCQITIVDSIIHVVSSSNQSEKGENGKLTKNSELDLLLNKYNVISYNQVYPFARTPQLQKVYEIKCDCEIDSLLNELETSFSDFYSSFRKIEYENIALYEPSDWLWTSQQDGWLWYLKKIEAQKAWDITQGNPNVIVGVIDTDFDITHPDLSSEIILPYDPYDQAPYSCQTFNGHGTSVASLVSGQTTETGVTSSSQLASIGFNTKMICYRAWVGNYLARALHASTVMGVDILTSSAGGWTSCPDVTGIDQLVVKEILDNGTTIIMPAGNGAGTHNFCSSVDPVNHCAFFPLSPYYDERIIIVTGTGQDDKHQYVTSNGTNGTHSHYPSVDICSPGYNVFVGLPTNCDPNGWPYSSNANGTSFATPIVAGVASLMYSVNPCLTPSVCQDILKNTTDPVVDAQNFPNGIGTGRVNAFKAVRAAQGAYSTNLDLYMKDRPEDFGDQVNPYVWAWDFDESPDIWVRNQNDGLVNQIHQEPEYNSSSPTYVYVRVRNKSCASSIGNEKVNLHWTKASSSNSWPQNWDGSSPTIGNIIGSQTIGVLAPGEDTILVFQWNVLNPYIHQNWASCLMARIVNSSTDLIVEYPSHAEYDVYYNNNIALRNVTVIDIAPGISNPIGVIDGIFYPFGKYIFIGNSTSDMENYNFTFSTRNNEPLSKYAETKLIFDEAGWNLVKAYFENSNNFRIKQPREVVILGDSASIEGITFPANLRIPVFVGFSFYGDFEQLNKQFKFDVRQFSNDYTLLIGGEHFVLNKKIRSPFSADAGADKEIQFGDNVLIDAVQIGEFAIYKWYDSDGELIYTGKEMSIAPDMTRKYKLEVVAVSDGSIAIDEVEVKVNKNFITSLSPNPANSNVTIDFVLDSISSAYLMVVNQTGTSFNNYIINPNMLSMSININDFQSGLYTVVLVCNGIAKDAKQLIIE